MRKIILNGLWFCTFAAIVAFAFIACNNPANGGNGNGDPVPVTGVSITQPELSLQMGTTHTLTATVTPANATNRAVTWTSSDTDIVTVSAAGLLTPVALGEAEVTVRTVDGNFAAVADITVVAAATLTRIEVTPAELVIQLGPGNTSATATVTITPTPAGASTQVEWESTNSDIATANGTTVTASGRALGTATLTATSTVDRRRTDSITVTVEPGVGAQVPHPVTGISFYMWGDILHPEPAPVNPGDLGSPGHAFLLNTIPGSPPVRVGSVPAFSREVRIIVEPDEPTVRHLTWTALSPSIATIGSTATLHTGGIQSNTITVGNTAGRATFRVSSRTIPYQHFYFALDVGAAVPVATISGPIMIENPLPSHLEDHFGEEDVVNWEEVGYFGYGDGAYSGIDKDNYRALGTLACSNRGIFGVQLIGPANAVPSDLRIGFHIQNANGIDIINNPPISANVIYTNHNTGQVWFQVTASSTGGTRLLPHQVVRIRPFSRANNAVPTPWFYIRVVQAFPATGGGVTVTPNPLRLSGTANGAATVSLVAASSTVDIQQNITWIQTFGAVNTPFTDLNVVGANDETTITVNYTGGGDFGAGNNVRLNATVYDFFGNSRSNHTVVHRTTP